MQDTLYERRRHYTIGNLGWDSPQETIVVRAIDFLNQLDIKPEQYEGPIAVRDKGSLGEVMFHDPNVGVLARLRARVKKDQLHHMQAGVK